MDKSLGDVKELFMDGDEVDVGTLRGAMLKFAKDRGVIPGGQDPRDMNTQYKFFQSWIDDHAENDYTVFQEMAPMDYKEFVGVMQEMFEEHEEFRELIKEKYIAPSKGYWSAVDRDESIGKEAWEKVDKWPDDQWEFENKDANFFEAEEDEMEDDEKHVNHEYPELHEIGIAQEGNRPDYAKIRGTMLSFASDVERIEGKKEECTWQEAKESWNRWMQDKLGNDWSMYLINVLDNDKLSSKFKEFYESNEQFRTQLEEKYEQNEEVLEGNTSPDEPVEVSTDEGTIGSFAEGHGTVDEIQVNGSARNKGDNDTTDVDIGEVTYTDVFHGDSVNVLDELIDRGVRVDAVITDPPYGMKYDSRGDEHDVIEGDDDLGAAIDLTEVVMKQCRQLTRKGSPVLVFAGQSSLRGVMDIVERWFEFKDINVWDKEYVGTSAIHGNPIKWRPMHEYAVLGCDGKPRQENENRHDGNVWHYQRLSGHNMNHPTEKPLELLRYVIESLTQEEEVILDPFAGSGSTLKAAHETNRKYIGVEIDEEYHELIKKRLSQQTLV